MEVLSIIILSFVVRGIYSAITDKCAKMPVITPEPESICYFCAYAHVARGFKASEELTYCTYAGVSRDLKFPVSNCSMFCPRNSKPEVVRVSGFAENQVDQSIGALVAAGLSD